MLNRVLSFITGVALFAFSLAACFFLAESVVRISKKAPVVYSFGVKKEESAYRLSENRILGYVLKEGYKSSSADNHRTFSQINSLGQRDIERSVEKPERIFRILMLGDSVVAGHGLSDLNLTISRQLEDLFAGYPIEVLNFGVGGYNTRAEVELLKTKGLAYEPDLVLLVFVDNDFANSNDKLIRDLSFERSEAVKYLFLNSHFFRWLSLRNNLFHFRDELLSGG